MYNLIEFSTEKEHIKSFLSLSKEIYKGDKNFGRENKKEIIDYLSKKHTCSKFLKQKNLIVKKNGVVLARGIAFVNELGNFGSIGFLECKNDLEAVKLIVDETKNFCKIYNIKKIYAPMNGWIWGDYRVMTKGFHDKTYFGEPYNKPYYFDVLTQCGFVSIKKWETQFVKNSKSDLRTQYIKRFKNSDRVFVRGMQNFDKDIRILHKLIMNSFADFFLFHKIDEETFVNLYKDLRKICDKRTMKLAFDKENKPIGFGLAYPDYQNLFNYLFKYAKNYILLYFGVIQENGKSVNPFAFQDLLSPIFQFIYSKNKGYICAIMSENSKALNVSKDYDYVHEYALLEIDII